MTEIKTTGIFGILNRISVFAHGMTEDVYDVSTFIDIKQDSYRLASNRCMLSSRTTKYIMTGQDMTQAEFLYNLSLNGGKLSTKEEILSLRKMYRPEFNTGTNKIGEGYRAIANIIMLRVRGDFHQKTGNDLLMSYQYIEMLKQNMGIYEEK